MTITVTDLPEEEEEKEDDEDEEDEEDEDQQENPHDLIIPDLIEVTGADGMNNDLLEMYFEGKRSGGGREKEVEWIEDVGDGVIHVKFSEAKGTHSIKACITQPYLHRFL